MKKTEGQRRLIVTDINKCNACRTCELACALAHSGFADIVEAILSEAPLVSRVQVAAAEGRPVPIQCQQCEDAPCVAVCPSGALYKDEEKGVVLLKVEKCIGCKCCVLVCPFGAVNWAPTIQRIAKCDLCEGIVKEGEAPRCVSGCPTGARKIVKLQALAKQRQREAAARTIVIISADQVVAPVER